MSAKALATCRFEAAADQTVATDHPAPEGLAAGIEFREALWREYQIEAIKAGFSAAQATQYASALSAETALVAGLSEFSPIGSSWFYHSRAGVAWRTTTSGRIELRRWRESKATGRTGAAGASILARAFRWWNAK